MTLTKEKNLSNVHAISKPCIHDKRIGIVTAQWNPQITEALRIACVNTLLEHHIKETDITQVYLPEVTNYLLLQNSSLIEVWMP
jgi:6,7-dimethyl-8-ribityllumazine synthase